MLCKSLRSTLSALLQATMLRIRATNRTIVGYVRCARFSQMQALASLFACGQPSEPGFTPQAARCTASCKITVSEHRETGICSCLLQSNPCNIFLCFAKAFGQPLKTTHRVVFLTLSFKSLLLSVEKQKRTSEFACPFCLAEKQGIDKALFFGKLLYNRILYNVPYRQ